MNAVVIPTYNEAKNASALVKRIHSEVPGIVIIVVDDNSPDNTGEIVRRLGIPQLHVLVRKDARGYGTAVRDGMLKALELGAEVIATMDSDFSHDPAALASVIDGTARADVAIGSRYVNGVRILNWPMKRLLLSIFANVYVRTILGLPAHDCTSGFRAYRAELLKAMNLKTIRSNGYSFLVEMLWRARNRRARLKEVPIIFEERREGKSKMGGAVIRESIFMPWKLRLARR
ncbi:polyprenol monophosphomannose synthase [Candidatus Sumerlaeota bacterium]|nr:polyprenol monophosphomannose synthase [Candidatus Sumerlaeota bacterium]